MANASELLHYSHGTLEAVKAHQTPTKQPPVVVTQTIPAGTQVKKGETVGVSVVSPSDVDLGEVVIPNFEVPVAIRKKSVGDIIELGKDDATVAILKNPSDPINQENYIRVVNKQLGTNFGTADVPALLTLQKTYNSF
jgi:hypothetical protein